MTNGGLVVGIARLGGVLVALVLFVVACSSGDGPSSSETTKADDVGAATTDPSGAAGDLTCDTASLVVGFATVSTSDHVWPVINAGAEDAATSAGVGELDIVAADADSTTQIQAIDSMIDRGVDALIIAPLDSAELVPAVERANAAGIPVVTVYGLIDGGDIVSIVATNHAGAAHNQAQLVGEGIGGVGKVIYVAGPRDQQQALDHRDGFVGTFTELFPDIEVLEISVASDGSETDGVRDLLAEHPDVAAIAHAGDEATLATMAIVAAEGIEPFIAGFDGAPAVMAALRRGDVDLVVAQDLYEIGGRGVEAAVAAACDEPVLDWLDSLGTAVPAEFAAGFIDSSEAVYAELINAAG